MDETATYSIWFTKNEGYRLDGEAQMPNADMTVLRAT